MSRPYFGLRKHRRHQAELEESGTQLWTDRLTPPVRVQFTHIIKSFEEQYYLKRRMPDVVRDVSFQFGFIDLSHAFAFRALSSYEQVLNAILLEDCGEDVVFSLLEAVWDIVPEYEGTYAANPRDMYSSELREVLEDGRISYDFVEGNIITRGEQEMHVEVVVPAITLLSGRSGFEDAERNYMDALTSIRESRFDDAVTDAASAVEVTLRIMGCGEATTTFEKRGSIAIERDLLASYDKRLLGWITATRGAEGDAHGRGAQTARADAWLVVHVAGALILRLVDGPNRGLQQVV
ncbi:hypothetical protein [Candidatus Poriferisocius sp.]|uniref:hypothetical protein n=1 Tax=Candidatus Poriferisocius sp. TaxID=3101276 RepID=UPI003B01B14C